MSFLMNLILMKRLLRQGWVRAGVPLASIESLADHSWSVTVLAFILSFQENQLRPSNKSKINAEKVVLKALFHDLPESEYFDMDKSVKEIMSSENFTKIQNDLEKAAIKELLDKFPIFLTSKLKEIMEDHESEEHHLVRVADLVDLLVQAREYNLKMWITEDHHTSFQNYALKQLKEYENQFLCLNDFLKENHLI